MTVPSYSHIVVVVEENHGYNSIIGNASAPYINNTLVSGGELLTNYHAISHPSEPNYFAMYAGSTFGVTNDGNNQEPDPTLYTILHGAGKSFTGYVQGFTDIGHDPWAHFPEGTSVQKPFTAFPTNFSTLPTVSFVIPDDNNNMHSGSIATGDTWLKDNMNAYAQWAKANNSLMVVVWDENTGAAGNHVASILYGAHIAAGSTDATHYNHYDLLSTLLAASGLPGPRNAASAAPFGGFV
jgi:hypothetical protein